MSKFCVSHLKEVTVALNTPFKADETVDLIAAKAVARYFLNKGIKSLYVCGSTGEGFLLDLKERQQVTEAVLEEVGGKMNVIVHVGCPSTRHSVLLAKHAMTAGASATSAVPSVYYHLGEESVFRHWMEIAQAADLPFFIYNIPQLTGFHMSIPLLKRMIENDRVAGMKCSSEAVHDILRFKQAGGDDFLVFSGSDEQYLAGRLMGADAGIGGTYGAMPELYLKLEDLIRRKEYDRAKAVQNRITPLIYRLCSFSSMYGAVKAVIALDGCPIGQPRLPFLPVSEKEPEVIKLYQDISKAIEETKNW
ncbi:dihydrodipicolinate synthase family protein [Lachnospiraceae bacterium 54-11]|jgi:N-acetylneuraminate lyase|nr:N-acetylneuraminate lyase [Lachnospiraceae bacterium]